MYIVKATTSSIPRLFGAILLALSLVLLPTTSTAKRAKKEPPIEYPMWLKDFKIPEVEAEELADKHFKNSEYTQAYDLYIQLAYIGDKYSMYMLSNMYLNGLGVKQDYENAYAWAHVAAENKEDTYIKHFALVNNLLAPEKKARSYLNEQVNITIILIT